MSIRVRSSERSSTVRSRVFGSESLRRQPRPARAARRPPDEDEFRQELSRRLLELELFLLSAVGGGAASAAEDEQLSELSPLPEASHSDEAEPKSSEVHPAPAVLPARVPIGVQFDKLEVEELSACQAQEADSPPRCSSDQSLRRSTTSIAKSAQMRHYKVKRAMARLSTETEVDEQKSKNRARAITIVDKASTMLVILNCITIGISADLRAEWFGWVVIDAVFTILFALEIVIKVVLQRQAYCCGPDRMWHVFEASLVVLGFVDLIMYLSQDDGKGGSDIELLRVLRLARITRMLRLTRMPILVELRMMVQGAVGGLRTLWWATVLMCVPLYMAAIMFRQALGDKSSYGFGADAFQTVPWAFFTLFRCVALNDCNDEVGRPIFALVASHHGWGYSFFYCLLGMFMSFGLFNVFVAIFVENVLSASRQNEGVIRRERLRNESFFAAKMAQLARILFETNLKHEGQAGTLQPETTDEEVLELCTEMTFPLDIIDEAFDLPQARGIFQDLSIAEDEQRHLRRVLDIDGNGEVDFGELFEGIQRVRGSPCRSDIVILNFAVELLREELSEQREFLEEVLGAGQGLRSPAAEVVSQEAKALPTVQDDAESAIRQRIIRKDLLVERTEVAQV